MRSLRSLAALVSLTLGMTACSTLDSSLQPTIAPYAAVRQSGDSAEAQYGLGKHYLNQGRPALALTAFTQSLAYDSSYVEARNGKANAFVQLGELDRAAAELQLALAASPDAAHLLNNLGRVRFLQQRYQEAEPLLRRALDLDPKNSLYRANWRAYLPQVYGTAGQPGAAGSGGSASRGLAAPSDSAVTEAGSRRVIEVIANGGLVDLRAFGAQPPADQLSRVHSIPFQTESSEAPQGTRNGDETSWSTSPPVTTTAMSAVDGAGTALIDLRHSAERSAPNASASAFDARPSSRANVSAPETAAMTTRSALPDTAPGERQTVVPPQAQAAAVEVINGNGTPGMAKRFADSTGSTKVRITRLANDRGFNVARSRVSFRDGYLAQALLMSARLPSKPEPVMTASMRAGVHVTVLLGHDVPAQTGFAEPDPARQASLTPPLITGR